MDTPVDPKLQDCGHEVINELFAEMVRAAHFGAWPRCDEFARDFVAALEAHLRREERVQFPRYAATSVGAAAEVERFLADHERLRQAAGRLFVDLRERHLELEFVGSFEVMLCDHAAREALRFAPWLESLQHESAST